MRDLISRQEVIDAINELTYPSSLEDVKRIIVDLPQAKQRQKKGKWIHEGHNWVRCSCCGDRDLKSVVECYRFCPACGADMKEVEE